MIEIEFIDDVYKQPFIEFVDDVTIEPDTEIIIEADDNNKELVINNKDVFGKWLIDHKWNPDKKSIVIGSETVSISSLNKEKYDGINEFLKRHKFDPKTETIQMYYKRKRLKCDMKSREKYVVAAVSIDSRPYSILLNKDNIVKGYPDSMKLHLPLNMLVSYGDNKHKLEATFQHECVHHEIQCGVEDMWKDVRKKLKKFADTHYKDSNKEFYSYLEKFIVLWEFIPYIDKNEELKRELDDLFKEYLKLEEKKAKSENDTSSSLIGKITDKISIKIMDHVLWKKSDKFDEKCLKTSGVPNRFADEDFIKNRVKSDQIKTAGNKSDEYRKSLDGIARYLLKKSGSNLEEMVADAVGLQRAEKILKENIKSIDVVGYSVQHAVNADIMSDNSEFKQCVKEFNDAMKMVTDAKDSTSRKFKNGVEKAKAAFNSMKQMCESEKKALYKYTLSFYTSTVKKSEENAVKMIYHLDKLSVFLDEYKKMKSTMKSHNIDRK